MPAGLQPGHGPPGRVTRDSRGHLTGYYFPGYPEAPPETYVYETKRRASRLGLDISRRGVEEKIDLGRTFGILRDAGYRGYAPLEILGPGDPRPRIRRFLDEAREALA